MRLPTALFALAATTAACAATPGAPPDTGPATVRDRLAQPTRLLVTPAQSTGSITARHYTTDGWQDGSVGLMLSNGELDVAAGADGELAMTGLAIRLAPVDIPASVFGQAAQLRDVSLSLTGAPTAAITWSDADHAVAHAQVVLDLDWTLVVNDSVAPLATQTLPAIPVDVTLSGSGDEVDATIDVQASGKLWSWADLLELDDLQLSLSAATVAP